MRKGRGVDSVNAKSWFSTAAEGSAILRLAVVIYFTVELQPRSLFLRRKGLHDLHQVADHFLMNAPDQGRSFWRNADHHFAPVLASDRAHDHSEIFQPVNQAARRRSGVAHFLGDGRHGQNFFLVEISQQKKLRKRNVARRELLAEMQNETPLHFQHDMGKLLGVGAEMFRRTLGERCFRVQSDLS